MTAVGADPQIAEELMTRLREQAAAALPSMPIAWPNVLFPAAGVTKPDIYLEVNLMRIPPRTIGISEWDELAGIMQVDVVYKAQDGAIKPLSIAATVASWFPRNTRMVNGDVQVDIYERPQIASPIADAPYTRIPVSIRYRSFVQ